MFYLIGIGLKPGQVTGEAGAAVQRCSEVYLENFTSRYAQGSIADLEKAFGVKVTPLNRQEVEEGFNKVLARARKKDIALLVFGNGLTATTHIQLLLDCRKQNVPCQVVPGVSVTNYLAKSGLDEYRFGRTATIVMPQPNYAPESFYDAITENRERNLHTLCLLDIDAEKNRLMSAQEALDVLLAIEKKRGKDVVKKARIIAFAALGAETEMIVQGRAERIRDMLLDGFPQMLVVCGKLTEKEREAVEALCES